MVKCSECGYLAAVNGLELVAFPAAYRNKESTISAICFVHQKQFAEQLAKAQQANGFPEATRLVLCEDRECQEFTEWIEGLDPKEHLEMNVMERARQREDERDERDRQWRESQAEKGREWREMLAAREHAWRQEDLARARQWQTAVTSPELRNVVYVAAAVGFATTVLTLVVAKLLSWLVS
jgi:hypothetical protein